MNKRPLCAAACILAALILITRGRIMPGSVHGMMERSGLEAAVEALEQEKEKVSLGGRVYQIKTTNAGTWLYLTDLFTDGSETQKTAADEPGVVKPGAQDPAGG